MDRVIQVHGEGVCFMDFGVKDSFSCTPLDPGLLPPLHLMWADAPSESGKVGNALLERAHRLPASHLLLHCALPALASHAPHPAAYARSMRMCGSAGWSVTLRWCRGCRTARSVHSRAGAHLWRTCLQVLACWRTLMRHKDRAAGVPRPTQGSIGGRGRSATDGLDE